MQLFEDHRHEATAGALKAAVYAISFSPDGTHFATGSRDGSALIRDAGGSVSSLTDRGPKVLPVHALCHTADGGALVVGGAFGWATYRRDEGGWRETAPKYGLPVTSLAALSERLVAVGVGDRMKASGGTFELWDVANDRKLQPFFEPNGVRAISVAPKKKLVAWATGHRKVRVWDITAPKPVDLPQERDCPAIALSADGTALAVASDWTTKVYDLKTRRERTVLKGHKGQVLSVAFSPDGATVATGSFDFTVRLWDAATGKERASYKWDIGVVYCLTYAPDGFRLAAGGDMGRVVVWDAE